MWVLLQPVGSKFPPTAAMWVLLQPVGSKLPPTMGVLAFCRSELARDVGALLKVLLQPVEHLGMPLQRVGRLQDPVVFIRVHH